MYKSGEGLQTADRVNECRLEKSGTNDTRDGNKVRGMRSNFSRMLLYKFHFA